MLQDQGNDQEHEQSNVGDNVSGHDVADVLEAIARLMKCEGNTEVTCEDGHRHEGVDVVIFEGAGEEIQSSEDSVPSEQRFDAIDKEDQDCRFFILVHCDYNISLRKISFG